MAIGTYSQIVTLDETDGAGGVRALDPPTWYCAPIAEGGGLLTLVGHYHAGLSTAARVHLKGRTFHVDGVLDRGGRGFQTQITCQEVFDASSDTPVLPSYHDLVVADGASHYWRLGETTGTTAVDLVGGANGAISGGVTLGQPGALTDGNTAMAFNGTTGKITPAGGGLVPLPFTWELWLKTNVAAGVERMLLSSFVTPFGPAVDAALLTTDTANHVYLYMIPGTGSTSSGSPTTHAAIDDNQWHHLVTVVQPTVVDLYLDGALSASSAASVWTHGTPVPTIGWRSDSPSFWSGLLDEVAIYPHALTAAQILAHYTAGTT